MQNQQASDPVLAVVTESYPLVRDRPRAEEVAQKKRANRLAVVVDAILICPQQNSLNVDSCFSKEDLLFQPASTKRLSRVLKPQLKRRIRSRSERDIKRVLAASRVMLENVRQTSATRDAPTVTRQAKSLKHPDPLACHPVAGSLPQAAETTSIKSAAMVTETSSSNHLTVLHAWQVSSDQNRRQVAQLMERLKQACQESEDLNAQLNLLRTQLANEKAIVKQWKLTYKNLERSQVSIPLTDLQELAVHELPTHTHQLVASAPAEIDSISLVAELPAGPRHQTEIQELAAMSLDHIEPDAPNPHYDGEGENAFDKLLPGLSQIGHRSRNRV